MDDGKELELEFVQPGLVFRIREGGHTALARVVHQHGCRAQHGLTFVRKRPHRFIVQHIASTRENFGTGEGGAKSLLRLGEPRSIAPAKRHGRPRRQKCLDRRQADAGAAASDHCNAANKRIRRQKA